MAAGILLGPSLLGWAAPEVSAWLFPPESLVHLNTVSQVGLLLFMFAMPETRPVDQPRVAKPAMSVA